MKKKNSLLGKGFLLSLFMLGEARADLVTGSEFYLKQGGFYLISHWGTNRTIFFLSVILTLLSLLLWDNELKKIK